MSVKIEVDDIIEFNNIRCYILLHKLYGEKGFSLKELSIEKSILAKVIVSYKDANSSGYVIVQKEHPLQGESQLYLINLPDLLSSKNTLLNTEKLYDDEDYPNK